MPRISLSNDYLLQTPLDCLTNNYTKIQSSTLSPNEINEILSRKLYEQLQITSTNETENNISTKNRIDSELFILIDRFFNLTYLNTIPIVNLLATAIATNFLKDNIQELDNKLREQANLTHNMKRGNSLSYQLNHENHIDDDNLSWSSAPN